MPKDTNRDQEYKKVYKASFEIEIEFTDEPMPSAEAELGAWCDRVIQIRKKSAERYWNLDSEHDEELQTRLSYLESTLGPAIDNLFWRIYWIEANAGLMKDDELDFKRSMRQYASRECGKLEAKRVRESISTPPGRTPNSKSGMNKALRSGALDYLIDIADSVCQKRGLKNFNKTAMSRAMYPEAGNPDRDRREYFKKFDITFEEIQAVMEKRWVKKTDK